AGADDIEMRRRIERAGLPDAAAARLPRVVIVLPGLASRIARLGHGVEAPEFLAVLDVERRDPSARACVASAVLNDDFAVGDERSRQEFLLAAKLVLAGDFLVPDDLAVLPVDRDDPPVRQVRDDFVFPEGDAARARRVALMLDSRIAHPLE